MSTPYFSEREGGKKPRTIEEISPGVWGGIVALLRKRMDENYFADAYTDYCPDASDVPAGTDLEALNLAVLGEHPDVPWPPKPKELPPTLAILDLLEFVHRNIAIPQPVGKYHDYHRHFHYNFDAPPAQAAFREAVNKLFARNGIAFDLGADGHVRRLLNPVATVLIKDATFKTGDGVLDGLLEDSRRMFTSADPTVRRTGLEKLWDAFERTKTIEPGADKKARVAALLTRAAPEPNLGARVNNEMVELTEIGNKFRIRHAETSAVELQNPEDVDLLFHRMFSLLHFLLKRTGRAA